MDFSVNCSSIAIQRATMDLTEDLIPTLLASPY